MFDHHSRSIVQKLKLKWRYLQQQLIFTTDDNREFRVNSLIGHGGQGYIYGITFTDITRMNAIIKSAIDDFNQTAIEREIEALQALTKEPLTQDLVTPLLCICPQFNLPHKNQPRRALIRPNYQATVKDITQHTTQLFTIICRVHDAGWIHGDIKSNNFFTYDNLIRLGDFGSAQRIQQFCFDDISCSYLDHHHMHAQRESVEQCPQLIDLYGYCLMIYAYLWNAPEGTIQWGDNPDERRLPYVHEVAAWVPRCDVKYHAELKRLFSICCVDYTR
jgi:serine/threonine protein kinase